MIPRRKATKLVIEKRISERDSNNQFIYTFKFYDGNKLLLEENKRLSEDADGNPDEKGTYDIEEFVTQAKMCCFEIRDSEFTVEEVEL